MYIIAEHPLWFAEHITAQQGEFDVVQLLLYHAVMPVLSKFPTSRVVMYAGDHLLAHVHVLLRDGRECTVGLDSLTVVGRVAMREVRAELLWIESNRAWLHKEWSRLNP